MKAILTFHSIDDSGSVLSYSPAGFDYLLTGLTSANIPIVDLTTLLASECSRGVALTFDDGMKSVFDNALPVLKKHDAPAHLFLTTNAIERGQEWPDQPSSVPSFEMLKWDEIEQLHDSGVAIDAHTRTHPDVRTLSTEALIEECETANDKIEQKLGRRPEYFAYPFGYHNRASRETCRPIYRASVTTELRPLADDEDVAALPRLDTYYLQSRQRVDQIDSLSTTLYLKLRWLLRTLRGTHCTARNDK